MCACEMQISGRGVRCLVTDAFVYTAIKHTPVHVSPPPSCLISTMNVCAIHAVLADFSQSDAFIELALLAFGLFFSLFESSLWLKYSGLAHTHGYLN